MNTRLLGLHTALFLAAAIPAQRLAAYMSGAAGGFIELQPPTAVLPGPGVPIVPYAAAPVLPPLPFPAGDSTFSNLSGLHWFTNGVVLVTQPTPTFPPAGPIFPPAAIPPALLGAIGGGPVTGIAIDPAANILYLTGAPGIVVGVLAIPGLPIAVAPFAIAGAAPPITGLEFDGVTLTLYAVNAAGVTYNFLPGGAPVAAPWLPPILLPGPAGDVAIDKTTRLNAWGLRPLYVVAGAIALDVCELVPLVWPAPMGLPEGLAFIDHPAAVPPVGGGLCPGTAGPVNFTNGPMATGNLGWTIGMTGLAPFGFAIFAFDVTWNPAFPLVNVVGNPLGLFPVAPPLLLFLGVANAAGTVTFPIALGAPIGAGPLYNQNATFCPADPTGFVFSPLQVIDVAGL